MATTASVRPTDEPIPSISSQPTKIKTYLVYTAAIMEFHHYKKACERRRKGIGKRQESELQGAAHVVKQQARRAHHQG
ncbi:hypothetical protein ACLOJK_005271, partial [Asimina triloba]